MLDQIRDGAGGWGSDRSGGGIGGVTGGLISVREGEGYRIEARRGLKRQTGRWKWTGGKSVVEVRRLGCDGGSNIGGDVGCDVAGDLSCDGAVTGRRGGGVVAGVWSK